jgi:hypothetical protein
MLHRLNQSDMRNAEIAAHNLPALFDGLVPVTRGDGTTAFHGLDTDGDPLDQPLVVLDPFQVAMLVDTLTNQHRKAA